MGALIKSGGVWPGKDKISAKNSYQGPSWCKMAANRNRYAVNVFLSAVDTKQIYAHKESQKE